MPGSLPTRKKSICAGGYVRAATGWSVRLVGRVPRGSATLNVESPRKTFLNFRNNLLMLYKNLPEKDLKHVMHARFWLDYIAAAKFLLTGHYPNARAVYEARKRSTS